MQPVSSILLLLLVNMSAGYLVPNPTGKFNVTLTTGPLIDYTRNDPFAPTPTPRALMLSVFQPAMCASSDPVPYMPNVTAEFQGQFLQELFNVSADFTSLFQEARLPVCSTDSGISSSQNDWPILLFSSSYSIPRLYYSAIASAIASEGFIVITIDHPEDANIIEYPDGHIVYGNAPNNPTDEDFTRYLSPRVIDASFIIDQLSNATAIAELLPQRGPRAFCTDRVAMVRHSLGGATAVIAAGQDSRIRGAINWDGTLFGSLPPSGLLQPVLYMAEDNRADASWVAAFPQLKGPKLWVSVANTTHESFADVLTLIQAAGESTADLGGLLGTIEPTKLVRIMAEYTAAWMKGVFMGDFAGPLLQGQEQDAFPEVSIVTKSNF